MRIARPQPAARASLTLLVAAWLLLAPVLVICTCPAGHAAVTAASHTNASCEHGSCPVEQPADTSPLESSNKGAIPHQDTSLTIDVTMPRSVDVIALPAFDVVVALLPELSLSTSITNRQSLLEFTDRAGPPAPLVFALASTILLI